MDELAGTENRIAVERMRYNERVQEYNTSRRSFPANITTAIFGFEEYPLFQAPESAKVAPKVDFARPPVAAPSSRLGAQKPASHGRPAAGNPVPDPYAGEPAQRFQTLWPFQPCAIHHPIDAGGRRRPCGSRGYGRFRAGVLRPIWAGCTISPAAWPGPESADELTQDVFVRVWQKLGTFRGESSFGTWLHRLAVNVIIERFRTLGTARDRFLADGEAVLDRLPGRRAGAVRRADGPRRRR